MKRTILFVLCCMVFVISCNSRHDTIKYPEAPTEEEVFTPEAQPMEFTKESQVMAVVEPETIPEGVLVGDAVQDKGIELGMSAIFSEFIQDAPLFTPFASENTNFVTPMIQTDLKADPYKDPVTGVYRQKYRVNARFVPASTVGGVIVNFQGYKTMGAFDDEIFIKFFTEFPEAPAYFLIAEQAPYEGEAYYQIYGGGILKQVVNGNGLAMILKTRKEVEIGDLVFLINVEAEDLEVEEMANQPEETNSMENEVVVEPVFKPEPLVEEPEEMK